MADSSHGILGSRSPQGDRNGFVNRRSTVQSRPPAQDSQNAVVTEEWRPIPGVDSWYEASSLGRIRRVARTRGAWRVPFVMKPFMTNAGYLAVALRFAGKRHPRTVHAMVAEAFLGPRPLGHQVNHIDGRKTNNMVDNLEYVTPKANIGHSIQMGLRPKHRNCRRCGVSGHLAKSCERLVALSREAAELRGGL